MIFIQDFFTRNDCYNENKKIVPQGIVVHSTATPGVMARDWKSRWNKSYAKKETTKQKCVHAFVDAKYCVQCLPWDHRGWHGGKGKKGSVNDTHIGFEICEPNGAKYNKNGTAFEIYNVGENRHYFEAIWNNSVELCVMLCKEFNLDPSSIVCHQEAARMGVASNHADVLHWFPLHGKSMDDFRSAVKEKLEQKLYKVQVTFANQANAEILAKELNKSGYNATVVCE